MKPEGLFDVPLFVLIGMWIFFRKKHRESPLSVYSRYQTLVEIESRMNDNALPFVRNWLRKEIDAGSILIHLNPIQF